MAFQSPNGLAVFRRGEPPESLLGKKTTTGMDVFRRSEPPESLLEGDQEGTVIAWVTA